MKDIIYSIIPRDMFVVAGLLCFYGILVACFIAAMLLPLAFGIILCEPHPSSP